MTKVIGFMGFSRSGKDTAAHQIGWTRAGFADALKSDIAPLLKQMQLDADRDKEIVRPLMVEYGRLGRAVSADYWIDRLAVRIPPHADIAIADVRYINEVRWIQRRGGIIIEVIRPGFTAANDEELMSFAAIEMERSWLSEIPAVVNNATPEELGRRALWHIDRFYRA